MYGEKKIVIVSIIVICVTIIGVYVLYFSFSDIFESRTDYKEAKITRNNEDSQSEEQSVVRNKLDKQDLIVQESGLVLDVDLMSGNDGLSSGTQGGTNINFEVVDDNKVVLDTTDLVTSGVDIGTGGGVVDNMTGLVNNDIDNNANLTAQLTDSRGSYLGEIDITQKLQMVLGVDYDGILVGEGGLVYAIHLGTQGTKILDKVNDLGGNIFVLDKPKDIEKNLLFGDKVTFINLPEYKDVYVIMIIKRNKDGDKYLLQINKQSYYKLKGNLKESFKILQF